ncbi:MAG: TIGR04255 family protein [Vulcanimicrobiota bacterium]
MNIPRYGRIHLEDNFLKEVICHIGFYDILKIENEKPVAFQDGVRGNYPKLRIEEKFELRKSNPLTFEPGLAKRTYTFSDKKDSWKTILTGSSISIHSLDYTSFEEFKSRILQINDVLQKCYAPIDYNYIGLRYVDVIDTKTHLKGGENWCSVVRDTLLGLYQSKNQSNEYIIPHDKYQTCHFQELQLTDEKKRRIIFKFGIPSKMHDKFILDIDYSFDMEFGCEQTPDLLEHLHLFTNNLFQWSLNEEFLKKYQVKE